MRKEKKKKNGLINKYRVKEGRATKRAKGRRGNR